MGEKILVIGDLHGVWNHLYNIIKIEKPNLIFSVGDFGWWPSLSEKMNLKTDVKILFCDGNHEDHEDLQRRIKNNDLEIFPNVFYQPRGSVFTLEDGRNVLFMGGANSIDRNGRTPGIDWFPEETIKEKDMYNLPDVKIDIVISHTCPEEFVGQLDLQTIDNDPSRKALSFILKHYCPKLWYFGHFHKYRTRMYNDCKWICLNMSSELGWYTTLG